jgi:hypothetical protein
MDLSSFVLFISFTLFLNRGKIGWHADTKNHIFRAAHAIGTGGLLGLSADLLEMSPGWVTSAVILNIFILVMSFITIDNKRKGGFHGSLFSGLSSYPWEILAALACFIAGNWIWTLAYLVVGGYGSILIWMSGRPPHWTPSRWEWMVPAFLKGNKAS